jgi:hypothetical protein
VFVGVPAQWMKFGSKGREGPPLGRLGWLGSRRQRVTWITSSVAKSTIRARGNLWNASKTHDALVSAEVRTVRYQTVAIS